MTLDIIRALILAVLGFLIGTLIGILSFNFPTASPADLALGRQDAERKCAALGAKGVDKRVLFHVVGTEDDRVLKVVATCDDSNSTRLDYVLDLKK